MGDPQDRLTITFKVVQTVGSGHYNYLTFFLILKEVNTLSSKYTT